MEITISVPKEVESVLAEKAAAEGTDIKTLVETMIKTQATRPTLNEILAGTPGFRRQWHDRRRVE